MDVYKTISIAEDFSETPASRYRSDGDYSAEQFFEELLQPAFQKAVDDGAILEVNLDGTCGYASSFISGSFGKLSEDFGKEVVFKYLMLTSKESKTLLYNVKRIIENPNSR